LTILKSISRSNESNHPPFPTATLSAPSYSHGTRCSGATIYSPRSDAFVPSLTPKDSGPLSYSLLAEPFLTPFVDCPFPTFQGIGLTYPCFSRFLPLVILLKRGIFALIKAPPSPSAPNRFSSSPPLSLADEHRGFPDPYAVPFTSSRPSVPSSSLLDFELQEEDAGAFVCLFPPSRLF